jgi:APA family basic amino acid/polyamine antiporter
MIGTGVFTSLGFQLLELRSGFVLLMLWVVGGVSALCGALCYAELGAALPRSGGEYNFLSVIYHPAAGFISGWVSATVGFAAPTALAALTFGSYFAAVFPALSAGWLATGLVLALTAVHCTSHAGSGGVQSVLTGLKLALILGFSVLALVFSQERQPVILLPRAGDVALLFSGSFAVSLIFVNYAFSGWNAATYVSGELRQPRRHLPIILVSSTLLVGGCYLLLNYTFLVTTPMEAMAGQVEIGFIAARQVFGPAGAAVMGVVLALLLTSTVSAMVVAGPRVLQCIGEDFRIFAPLARVNKDGVPIVAIAVQSGVSLLFLWTSSFERILVFSGVTMALNTFFAVLGVFILRRRPGQERPYDLPLYPLPPLLFLGVTGWTLVYAAMQRPIEALMCAAVLVSGGAFYLLSRRLGKVVRAVESTSTER